MSVLIAAWRLMLSSAAVRSSSFSMGDAKSTFTLRIGSIIRPEFVKKRETSLARSASRAIPSAEVFFRISRVRFIKSLLLRGGLPQGHKMVILAFPVFPHLEDHAVQAFFHPAN